MNFNRVMRKNNLSYPIGQGQFIETQIPETLKIPKPQNGLIGQNNIRNYIQEPCIFTEKQIAQNVPLPQTVQISRTVYL